MYKVKYKNILPEIDFFKSMGSLTRSNWCKWFSNDNIKSTYINKLPNTNYNEWHKQHWYNYNDTLLTKFTDWNRESEYRMLLTDTNKRKLKYNFNDLESVVFGCNMNDSNKSAVIKILDRKCKENNRTNFNFYQAEPDMAGKMIIKKW